PIDRTRVERTSTVRLVLILVLGIADCGLRIDCGLAIESNNQSAYQPAIPNQSAIRIPQSAIRDLDRGRVLAAAEAYLTKPPQTIPAFPAPRSSGGLHDFFSEGDYWWPNPADPGGPYIRRDGESNPQNFVAHRGAMIRLSVEVPALVSAWTITKDRRFAD